MECFICGISDDKTVLVDVIFEKGIEKICKNCLDKENLPMIKKARFEPEIKQSVYERLSRIAGINPEDVKPKKTEELKFQEENLRNLIDKNFSKSLQDFKGETENPHLLRNFHWIVMRVRRQKHLSQKQLAEAISESEIAVKMAEQGVLSKGGDRLIKKLEGYLGINLSKKDESAREDLQVKLPDLSQQTEEIDLSSLESRELTIADLQKISKQKERRGIFRLFSGAGKKEGKKEEKKEEEAKEDLSDGDIRDLIFGEKSSEE